MAADAKARLGGGSPLQKAAEDKAKARPTARSIVETWAADLTPKNAPDAKNKGPLAWVREVEVGKLIAALEKEGYR